MDNSGNHVNMAGNKEHWVFTTFQFIARKINWDRQTNPNHIEVNCGKPEWNCVVMSNL